MTNEELEIKKFEFDQKIQLEEIELKKKEFELKIQEQKSQRIFTPLLISIVGGLVTIMTGIILKYYDNRSTLALEEQKAQSSLLLKVAEAKTYDEFINILDVFQANGFIKIDSAKMDIFKKKKSSTYFKQQQSTLYREAASVVSFLTVNADYNSVRYKERIQRFWELYWVELSSVESPEVEEAMKDFGDIIEELQRNKFKDLALYQSRLKASGYNVAQAIKKSSQN